MDVDLKVVETELHKHTAGIIDERAEESHICTACPAHRRWAADGTFGYHFDFSKGVRLH